MHNSRLEPEPEETSMDFKLKTDEEAPGEGKGKTAPSYKAVMQIFAALFYGFCAVSMNFVNKGVILKFPLTNVLLMNQMFLALLILPSLKVLGYVSYPDVTRQRAVSVLGVTILYVANVAFSLMSLSSMNIVFYSTMKRLTPMLVLVMKAAMTKRMPPTEISLSVCLVVAGCIVAGIGDFEFDLKGYLFALTSCCLQASYLLLVEWNGETRHIGSTELMVYNAMWSLPALFLVVVGTGEAKDFGPKFVAGVEDMGSVVLFTAMLIGCGTFGMLLNFSQFLCTMCNSALTTTIVGVLKGVAAVALGFVAFGGTQAGITNLTGIALNTIGAVWYAFAKYKQKESEKGTQ